MPSPTKCFAVCAASALGAILALKFVERKPPPEGPPKPWFQGTLLAPERAGAERLAEAKRRGEAIALELTAANRTAVASAARLAKDHGVDCYYWVEIGRDPALAEAHPEWMASLQGHEEWRRFHPNLAKEEAGGVVKTYPWTPILYQEVFEAQLGKTRSLLADLPPAKGIFLNDLQGGPSACGCGHPLCRWTSDYGPLVTAKRLGDDAAARFVREVKALAPGAEVIPVWATECEEHDKSGLCAGVGCFAGTCWKAYSKQLGPLAKETNDLAALCLFREFQREAPRYGPPGQWVKTALETFETMPPKRGGEAVSTSRVIAVAQGWSVTPEEVERQVAAAKEAGARGVLVAEMKIEQGWEPRLFPAKK